MTSEPSESTAPIEESVEDSEPNAAEAAQTAPPALNRAARRAQAKGKKGASGTPAHGGLPSNQHFGGGSHPSFLAGKSRIPRTGHK